jgi:SAM-dependent methyltransferase
LPRLRALLRPWTKQGRRDAYVEALPSRLSTEWHGLRKTASEDGVADVACRDCPKFSAFPPRCRVPMGSRIRACICAAAEYNLRDVAGKDVLEIGCAERSFGRAIVEASGGRWLSVDPNPESHRGAESLRTYVGHAASLPFADQSFDVVFGIQTLEHWEDENPGVTDCDYPRALAEIWRVLRPGGWVYFDAPIHLHGAAAFVRGDVPAIRGLFGTQPWANVRLEGWRRLHRPLPASRPPKKEIERWPARMTDGAAEDLADLTRRSVWLLTVRAEKPQSENLAPERGSG